MFGYAGCRSRFASVYVGIRTYELRGWFFVAECRSSFSETAESITSINEVAVVVIKERTSLSFFFFFLCKNDFSEYFVVLDDIAVSRSTMNYGWMVLLEGRCSMFVSQGEAELMTLVNRTYCRSKLSG